MSLMPVNKEWSTLGRLLIYAQVSLIMLFSVYLLWAFMGGIDAQYILYSNKDLADTYAGLIKANTSNEQLFIDILRLVAPKMHWFGLALVSSVVGFALLGWLLGRMLDCAPDWAGILPILDVLSGLNPLRLNSGGLLSGFTWGEQLLLLGVQIICIQWVAAMVYERRRIDEKAA